MSRDLSKLSDDYISTEWMAIVDGWDDEPPRPSWRQRFLELLGQSAICWAVPTVPPPDHA